MEHSLKAPLKEEEVRKLRVGDIVYLDGLVYTMRDSAHMRALKYVSQNRALPVDLKDGVVFHAGPIVKKENTKWKLVVVGPTASPKLTEFQRDFIRGYKIRGIVGKDGMGEEALRALNEFGVVYMSFTGGAALVCTEGIQEIVDVYWLDLGIPEAIWVLKVHNWGPLIVAMDSNGSDLYREVKKKSETGILEAKRILGLKQIE